jgi:hypothetical protein
MGQDDQTEILPLLAELSCPLTQDLKRRKDTMDETLAHLSCWLMAPCLHLSMFDMIIAVALGLFVFWIRSYRRRVQLHAFMSLPDSGDLDEFLDALREEIRQEEDKK